MKRLSAAALLLPLAALLARADDPGAPIKVPFGLIQTQHMTVMVKVNGAGPFRLIFDTGAPVTLLDNRVAKEAGLIKKDSKGAVVPLFGGIGQYKVKTLEVGDVRATDVPVMVMDHPTVKLVGKHVGGIDGIVGFSFFARYRVTIDYQKKELTFVPTKYRPANLMQKMLGKLLAGKQPTAKVLAPAGVWGFSVHKEEGDKEPGVTVKTVLAKGPAEAAGLRPGDRLLTLDGRWTDSVVDCYRAARHVRPGSTAQLAIRRDGKEMRLTVQVQSGL